MPASRGIIQLVEKHVDVSTRENQNPQRGLLLDSSFSSPAGQHPLSIAVTQQPAAQSSFRDSLSLSLFLSLSRLLVNSRPGQKEKARRKETRVVSPDARPPATFQNAIRPGTTVTFSRSTNEGARVVWVNERPKGWRRWRGVRGLFSLLTFLSFSLSLCSYPSWGSTCTQTRFTVTLLCSLRASRMQALMRLPGLPVSLLANEFWTSIRVFIQRDIVVWYSH